MKRTLLILGILIAACASLWAQTANHIPLREGNPLRVKASFDEGFSYFNRALMSAEGVNIKGVGADLQNAHLVSGIQLPHIAGVTITGIQFAQNGKNTATIFVGERAAGSKDDTPWKLLAKKQLSNIKDKFELNTALFDATITTQSGKEYIVGYEVISSNTKAGIRPLGYSRDSVCVKNGNLIAIKEDGTSNLSGSTLKTFSVSEKQLGNATIVVLCQNPSQYFSAPFYLVNTNPETARRIGSALTEAQNVLPLNIESMSLSQAQKATFGIRKNGEAATSVEVSIHNNYTALPLGALSKPGLYNYQIELQKVNGKEVSLKDAAFTSTTYSVNLVPVDQADPFKPGISYFNRMGLATEEIRKTNVGLGEPNIHLASAIQLPIQAGLTISGVEFMQLGSNEVGIFIAERPVGSKGKWTIVKKKTFNNGVGNFELNSFSFDQPLTTEAGKEYVVGYETKATDSGKGKFPLGYAKESISSPYANFIASKEDGSSYLTDSQIQFDEVAENHFGNALVVAVCTNAKEVLAAPFYLQRNNIPTFRKIATSLPAKENVVTLPIASMLREAAHTATFQVSIDGQTKQVSSSVKEGLAQVELGELTNLGENLYTIVLKQVNGKAISFTDPVLTTATYTVNLINPNEVMLRNSLLVERYTTEKCPNCPAGDERLQQAYKMVNFPIYEVAHHTGYGSDFLTLKEDSIFMEKYIVPKGGYSFAPAIVINRLHDARLAEIGGAGNQAQGMLMFPLKVEKLVDQFKYVMNLPAEGTINTVTRKAVGKQYTYTITGKVLNNEEVKNDLYVTMYLTENEIPAQEQAAAGVDFIHNNVLRKFITPSLGKKVTCKADGSFSVDIENVAVPTIDEECKQFVIFIHRSPANPDYNKRYIHAVVEMPVEAEQGVSQLQGEAAPTAYAQNGHIYIKGMADSFVVYSISGEQVATSSNEQLPQGIYIVRIQLADSFYTSKVVVK